MWPSGLLVGNLLLVGISAAAHLSLDPATRCPSPACEWWPTDADDLIALRAFQLAATNGNFSSWDWVHGHGPCDVLTLENGTYSFASHWSGVWCSLYDTRSGRFSLELEDNSVGDKTGNVLVSLGDSDWSSPSGELRMRVSHLTISATTTPSRLSWSVFNQDTLALEGYSGTLPTQMGLMRPFRFQYYGGPGLFGTLPTEIGNWASSAAIVELDVSNAFRLPAGVSPESTCSLSGTLPTELGRLSRLQVLRLGRWQATSVQLPDSNRVSGTIPTQLGLLSNLNILAFGGQPISGTIPAKLSSTSSALRELFMSGLLVSGTMPPELALLPRVRGFGMDLNFLSGSFPTALSSRVLSSYTTYGLCVTRLEPISAAHALFTKQAIFRVSSSQMRQPLRISTCQSAHIVLHVSDGHMRCQ